MSSRFPKYFMAFGLLVAATVCDAVQVTDLYQASAPIVDRSDESRRAGMRQAMAQVLVKLTGDPAAAGAPETLALRNGAERYVQQFSYEMKAVSVAVNPTGQQTYLNAVFDQATLTAAIREAGLPIWGRERPGTLVWLAVVNGEGERQYLGSDESGPVREALDEAARDRGIPLLLPLLDIEERAALQDDLPDFALLSEPYAADAVLVVEVKAVTAFLGGPATPDELYDSQWRFVLADEDKERNQDIHWEMVQATLPVSMAGAVERVANELALRYVDGDAQRTEERLTLTVIDVSDVDHYARTVRYLENLDIVTAVAINAMSDKGLEIQVAVRGGLPLLQQTVEFGSVLRSVEEQPGTFRVLP
ncbi:MAG: DUF2066 domain-containing protein [Gammaproteobacteria bacterium]|nr:DUF2066 domain-containing protein [Gammaproteobacteria bacterium]